MRAPDGARAEAVHRRMVALGVVGDGVTYNSLIKALSYSASAGGAASRGSLLSRAGGGGGGEPTWDLHKVRKVEGRAGQG